MDEVDVEKSSNLPVTRLFRDSIGNPAETVLDHPFDPDHDDWSESPIPEGGYDLTECYDRIEAGLMSGGGALLKDALVAEGAEDGKILDLTLTLVQFGLYQGIFKVDCLLSCEGQDEPRVFSFIAGVSRHRDYNDFVREDHRTLGELRKTEAESLGLKEDDPKFEAATSFPKHYGDCESEGGEPYFYLAPFLKGYYELNLYCRKTDGAPEGIERRVSLNGINQGMNSGLLKVERSAAILFKIVDLQLAIAAKCKVLIQASFNSGDFLYSPKDGKLLLHTYRKTPDDPSPTFDSLSQGFEIPMISVVIAYQILGLIAVRGQNLPGGPAQYDDSVGKMHLAYPTKSIAMGILETFKSNLLGVAEREGVLKLIKIMHTRVSGMMNAEGSDEKDNLAEVERRFDEISRLLEVLIGLPPQALLDLAR